MIRLTIPSIEDDDIQAVGDALASGYLVQGKRVKAFEQAIALLVGTQYAVAVSNCTSALHLALLVLGVHPDDLVIVTTYSWVATANVIELCGAQPVFVDIQPDTFNMDPARLAETLDRLMSNVQTTRRVKAILPVHTFGQMADMPAIMDLAREYHLPVVEDAACALGAKCNGKQAGTWGILGCFSFHPRKAITTGEGGMIVTNDPDLAQGLRALRNHGQDPDSPTTDFIQPGFNTRMTEFQAALGITQLSKLDRILVARRESASSYDQLLAGSKIKPPKVSPENQHVYQSYVVLLPKDVASNRQLLIDHLKRKGIETTIGTWHIPITNYYSTRYGYQRGNFQVTDDVFERALTLPLYEGITLEQQSAVIRELENGVRNLQDDI